jgi:hypothetical protein
MSNLNEWALARKIMKFAPVRDTRCPARQVAACCDASNRRFDRLRTRRSGGVRPGVSASASSW